MKAAWYERVGQPHDVLQVGELDTPAPRHGELCIQVHASGVNPSDANRRRGEKWPRLSGPIIPHCDGAGVVVAAGAGVSEDWVGRRVWTNIADGYRQNGTAAQSVCLPLDNVAPLPDNTSYNEGACLGVPAMTAHCCLFSNGSVAGKDILVTGGAGAVGHYAIQLAKWAGARVIATVSSDEKAAVADEAGADLTLNYRMIDVARAVKDFTNGIGVDRIVDVDFGGNLETLFGAIRTGGVIATYASRTEETPNLPVYPAMMLSLTTKFVLLPTTPGALRSRAKSDIVRWLETGRSIHRIAREFTLEEIADCHTFVEAKSKIGCAIVVLP
ncbi:NADPH:quinone reductase [Pelagibius sp.]|uniref:NADPH:quinone reductase n=1 Tax=Pelagibius sp. TaxID=1931238 RepID=UPI003B513196